MVTAHNIVCCHHISLNEIVYTYMQENSDHRSTIDHIFISDQLCNHLIKYWNMDSAINFSDHSPVIYTLALPNLESVPAEGATVCSHKANDKDRPMKSHYSYRCDRADLQGFYDSTAYLLQTIKLPMHLLADMCQDVTVYTGIQLIHIIRT